MRERIVIGPHKARELLQKNTHNRKLDEKLVMRYAKDMKAGVWPYNGESIKMSGDRVLDGQHRLNACIISNTPFETDIIYNLDSDVFTTIDCGKRRSQSDALFITGHVNTRDLAACASLVNRYMTGRMLNAKPTYTNKEMLELVNKYKGIEESVKIGIRFKKMTSASLISACHYLFSMIDKNTSEKFFNDLLSGANMDDDDPVFLLRERLMENRMAKAKLKPEYLMALCVKAWNARRQNAKIKCLRMRENGDAKELFPIIK